jgi:hypothetical protein
MSQRKNRMVREPIQTYLAPDERQVLDRLARDLNLSRAEVLRRGLSALADQVSTPAAHPFDQMVGAFNVPGAPTDLAINHDKYLAEAYEAEWHRPRKRKRPRST